MMGLCDQSLPERHILGLARVANVASAPGPDPDQQSPALRELKVQGRAVEGVEELEGDICVKT